MLPRTMLARFWGEPTTRRRGWSILILAALVASACVAAPETAPTAEPPPVTEQYLRRQVAVAAAEQMMWLAGDVLAGPLHRYDSRLIDVSTERWLTDQAITGTYIASDGVGQQRHLALTATLTGPYYVSGAGSVTESGCRTLPGSGTSTTGQYRTVDNTSGSAAVAEHYEQSVTETSERVTELTRSVELSSKTTVTLEADAPFGAGKGSISQELSATLGVSSDSTDDETTSTTETESLDVTVDAGTKTVIVISEDVERVRCDVAINGVADWSTVDISAVIESSYIGQSMDWARACKFEPALWANWCRLQPHHDAYALAGDELRLEFGDGIDGLARFAAGDSVLLPPGWTWPLAHQAQAAASWLADPARRHISFAGSRTSQSARDASYRLVDATGATEACIDQSFGAAGKDLALDDDGAC